MWILDSGCSNHMIGDKAMLSQFEEKASPQITFEDDDKGFTMGYGNLNVGNVIIKEISLVGGLKHNLLSTSQFIDKGYKVEFVKNRCLITHKKIGELDLSGVRKGSFFIADLDSTNKEKICYFYTKASSEESMLWHKKLSHLNFKAIKSLVKREMLRDITALQFKQEEVYEACQKGKNEKIKS